MVSGILPNISLGYHTANAVDYNVGYIDDNQHLVKMVWSKTKESLAVWLWTD